MTALLLKYSSVQARLKRVVLDETAFSQHNFRASRCGDGVMVMGIVSQSGFAKALCDVRGGETKYSNRILHDGRFAVEAT